MKFCMRRRDRYECDFPHHLPLDGKYSRENKAEFTKSAVHFGLRKSSMFQLEVNWNTYSTCVLQLMVYEIER